MQSIKAIRLMATIDDCVSIALLIDPKDELLQALANLRLQGCIQGLGPGSLGLFGRQANVDLADLGMGEKSDRGVGSLFDQILEPLIHEAFADPEKFEDPGNNHSRIPNLFRK